MECNTVKLTKAQQDVVKAIVDDEDYLCICTSEKGIIIIANLSEQVYEQGMKKLLSDNPDFLEATTNIVIELQSKEGKK